MLLKLTPYSASYIFLYKVTTENLTTTDSCSNKYVV